METCKKTVAGSVDRAIPVDSPEAAITEEADVLFLGAAVYAHGIDRKMKDSPRQPRLLYCSDYVLQRYCRIRARVCTILTGTLSWCSIAIPCRA